MSRIPAATREGLAADFQPAWDRVLESRGAVRGPFGVLMHVPALGGRVAEIGDYLRFHGLLPKADTELATIVSAREIESRYEWAAHEPLALQAGVPQAVVDVVLNKGSLDSLSPRQRVIVEVVRALYRDHRLSEALFRRALAELGQEQLVEVVTLAGFYQQIGFTLNSFEVDLPAGATARF
jgi:4-carboxymuconolactone decarboxylase